MALPALLVVKPYESEHAHAGVCDCDKRGPTMELGGSMSESADIRTTHEGVIVNRLNRTLGSRTCHDNQRSGRVDATMKDADWMKDLRDTKAIFVGDDERIIAHTLAIILRQNGFDARAFVDGLIALSAASFMPTGHVALRCRDAADEWLRVGVRHDRSSLLRRPVPFGACLWSLSLQVLKALEELAVPKQANRIRFS